MELPVHSTRTSFSLKLKQYMIICDIHIKYKILFILSFGKTLHEMHWYVCFIFFIQLFAVVLAFVFTLILYQIDL